MNARERMLDAAVKRIAREGIDEVRIARIAQDAGVSASLVHYHFDSRDALLAEALEHSYERVGDVRIGDGDSAAVPPAERLAAMIDQCLPAPGSLHDDFILWVELWLRAARRPKLRETSARLYGRMHEWFREVLAELEVADPAALADRVLALCDGGIRVLCEDPAMPRERAAREIRLALEAELP